MKADLTRGAQPDRTRGRTYRRVLLQQGRALLDSDVAALVDALDGQIRDLTQDLGCLAGSPDLGFLLTPGPLLAVFEDLDRVTISAGDVERSYTERYLDRYPSLRLEPGATVTIAFRGIGTVAAGDTVRIWYKADVAGATASLGAGSVSLGAVGTTDWQVAEVSDAADQATLTVSSGAAVLHVALVEQRQDTSADRAFWAAAGRFHLSGVAVGLASDTSWPEVSAVTAFEAIDFDTALPSLTAGGQLVAYLDVTERHVTHVEDAGIRENALGGTLDTTTRTLDLPRIHLVDAGALAGDADSIRAAFADVVPSGARLIVDVPPSTAASDPCALPEAGGYVGTDNRLYRIEIHATDGASALVKWSRDNGSQLFAVDVTTGATPQITVASSSGLASGDLVELLGEYVELGMAEVGALTGGRFSPGAPRVGGLYLLRESAVDADGNLVFDLLDTNGDPGTFSAADHGGVTTGLKVRVWHGTFEATGLTATEPDTATDPPTATLEDGVQVWMWRDTDPLRVGDWWAYEARTLQSNDNGTWRQAPHGPEHRYAPLALFEFVSTAEPLTLIAWLDERFAPLCELTADDIAFDNDGSNTSATTVQEAIDDLLSRSAECCCQIWVESGMTIAEAIDQLPANEGGEVCLRGGVTYYVDAPIPLDGTSGRVVVKGCPEALIVGRTAADEPIFDVKDGGELVVEQVLLARFDEAEATAPLVRVDGVCSFTARETGFCHAAGTRSGPCVAMPGATVVVPTDVHPYPADPGRLDATLVGPRVVLEQCVLAGDSAVVGGVMHSMYLSRTVISAHSAGLFATEVGLFHCERSVIVTQLTSADLAGLGEANVASSLLGVVAATLEAGVRIPSGPAVLFEAGFDGSVQQNRLIGTTCFWLGHAARFRFEGNQYAGDVGVRADTAVSVSAIAETSLAGIGYHVPLWARYVEISSSDLAGSVAGVILGADAPGVTAPIVLRFLWDVHVANNRFNCTSTLMGLGVQLGEPPENDPLALHLGVLITGNSVFADVCVVAHVVSEVNASQSCTISDNHLAGYTTGIEATGALLQIVDNRVSRYGTEEAGVAISVVELVDGRICGNHVYALGESTGIDIDGGSRSTVQNNTIKVLEDAVDPTELGEGLALRVADHESLLVTGNQVYGVRSELLQTDRVAVRSNTFAGSLKISASVHGSVSGNAFGSDADLASLTTSGLTGEWQVENNRGSGSMTLLPALEPAFGLEDLGILAYAVQVSAATKEPTTSKSQRKASPSHDAKVGKAAVFEDMKGVLVDPTEADARELDQSVESMLLLGDEEEWQVQVVGNWFGSIQVGYDEADHAGHGDTIAMVVANRSDGDFAINRDYVLVASNNSIGGTDDSDMLTTAASIVSPNLEL